MKKILLALAALVAFSAPALAETPAERQMHSFDWLMQIHERSPEPGYEHVYSHGEGMHHAHGMNHTGEHHGKHHHKHDGKAHKHHEGAKGEHHKHGHKHGHKKHKDQDAPAAQ
jgi:hypothetical protein